MPNKTHGNKDMKYFRPFTDDAGQLTEISRAERNAYISSRMGFKQFDIGAGRVMVARVHEWERWERGYISRPDPEEEED